MEVNHDLADCGRRRLLPTIHQVMTTHQSQSITYEDEKRLFGCFAFVIVWMVLIGIGVFLLIVISAIL